LFGPRFPEAVLKKGPGILIIVAVIDGLLEIFRRLRLPVKVIEGIPHPEIPDPVLLPRFPEAQENFQGFPITPHIVKGPGIEA
jgi:hypothetical protein